MLYARMFARRVVPTSPEGVVRLEGHTSAVFWISELPGCGLLATVSKDNRIRFFDSATGVQCRTDFVPSYVYPQLGAPGDNLLTTKDYDHARVWDARTGECVGGFPFRGFVNTMASMGHGRFVAGDVSDLAFFEHNGGRDIRETRRLMNAHCGVIFDIAVCETRIASASSDTTTRVWEAGSGVSLVTLRGHRTPVLRVDLSLEHIAAGAEDGTVIVYNATSFALIFKLDSVHKHPCRGVNLAGDGLLVSFSRDGTVAVTDVRMGRVRAKLNVRFPLCCGKALHDGRLVAVGQEANAIIFKSPVQLWESANSSVEGFIASEPVPCSVPSRHVHPGIGKSPPRFGSDQLVASFSEDLVDAVKGRPVAGCPGRRAGSLPNTEGIALEFEQRSPKRTSSCPHAPQETSNRPGPSDEGSDTRSIVMGSDNSSQPADAGVLDLESPSLPMSGIVNELVQIVDQLLRKDVLEKEFSELAKCTEDGGRRSARSEDGSLRAFEREEQEEGLLKCLDERFPVWIRELKLLSDCVSETEKLAAIARMEDVWMGWTVSPEDISYDQDEFGLPIELGRGGMGVVYRGSLCSGGENARVAIKTLAKEITVAGNRISFVREVLVQYRVNHPNIVEFKGAFWPKSICREREHGERRSSRDKAFIASELMTTDLRTFRKGPFLAQIDTQLMVLLSVAKALEHLHSLRIVHQDVSPDNVLLRLDEKKTRILAVKVADFGTSRMIRRTVSRKTATDCAAGGGKYEYMAPEALLEDRRLEFSVDVWSFGVLCTFVVLGQTALHGVKEFRVWKAADEKTLDDICMRWARNISNVALRDLCISCMHGNPSSRPPMRDVRRRLDALIGQ